MTYDTRDALMRAIQEKSFAAVDTNLFLDSHPKEKTALLHYRKNAEELCLLREAYEEEYGPLTSDDAGEDDVWRWATDSWPWQEAED